MRNHDASIDFANFPSKLVGPPEKEKEKEKLIGGSGLGGWRPCVAIGPAWARARFEALSFLASLTVLGESLSLAPHHSNGCMVSDTSCVGNNLKRPTGVEDDDRSCTVK
jgi:hypothetical protein